MKPDFYIQVVNGEIVNEEAFIKWQRKRFAELKDGRHRVTVEDLMRSDAQNSYYWSQITQAAFKAGITPKEYHDFCKESFLPTQEYIVLIVKRGMKSSKELFERLFSEYIDQCAQHSAECIGYVWGDSEEYKFNKNNNN